MSCRLVRKHETEFLDGVLQPSLARNVETHLYTCPACRQRLDELAGTLEALRSITAPLPPGDLFARVVLRAETEPRLAERVHGSLPSLVDAVVVRPQLLGRFASFAAALVLLVALVGVGGPGVADAVPTELRPEETPLVQFSEDVHEMFDETHVLTVVAAVQGTGDALVKEIVTPADLYTNEAVSLAAADAIVVMMFESIWVNG